MLDLCTGDRRVPMVFYGRDRTGDPLLANSESEFGWSEEE